MANHARSLYLGLFSSILAVIALIGAPKPVMAQSIQTSGEALKNAVTGPINDLMKPLEAFKSTLESKVPQTTTNIPIGSAKNFLEQNGVTYDSASNTLNKIVEWFNARLNAINSPAFITWAVDFLKRFLLLMLELLNKIVSYL